MSYATDLTAWTIGPYHSALPGPMRIRLELDGEIIASGEVETGYLHRGIEKALEKHTWFSAMTYADRMDPENAFFGELALALAVEEIGEIEVPPRAQQIRVIVGELARISSHFGYIVRMARAVSSETMLHYVLRDREKILDLFELVTGARFSLNFVRFSGVGADVTEGFMERVLEVCDLIRIRLKEYNDLLTFNHGFLKRTRGIGVLGPEHVFRYGMSGPNARAAGVAFDVRKAHPYTGYQKLDFDTALLGEEERRQSTGCHGRFLIRLKEISQSIEILKEAVETISPGEFCGSRPDKDFKVRAGEAYSRVESSRGLLGCHVVSDGGPRPARVQFRVPSMGHLAVVTEAIVGARVEDLPVILASLDIGVAEVDR